MAAWDPLLDPKNPPEKFMQVPFLRPFPRKWGTQFFLEAQNEVFWVGAKQFMLRKFLCAFRSPKD